MTAAKPVYKKTQANINVGLEEWLHIYILSHIDNLFTITDLKQTERKTIYLLGDKVVNISVYKVYKC